uniref:BHLH domain-containing protein n=1 Tax=Oryza glumipatula TaxID=40148 RepID=A0A0E0BDM0_9ORYZ
MNQCVPSWDLDDPVGGGGIGGGGGGGHRVVSGGGGGFMPVAVPTSDQYYEVAELTWKKGNISSHGLLLNRPAPPKFPPHQQLQAAMGGGGGGGVVGDRETLEAVVGEAAARSSSSSHLAARARPVPAPWLGSVGVTDKASMLDEVIDYLKQLQAQVQVMSRMGSMMMPMGMAMPQLQMSVMAQMAQMAQIGLSMMNMGQAGGYAPMHMHTPPFLPVSWDAAASSSSAAAADRPPQPTGAATSDAFSAFLASQAAQQNAQQPNGMEAYNRMMAMYQKLNHQQQQQDQPSNSRQ